MRWAAILAGGKGERLWPLSRSGRPKQLATLTGDTSMIRLTMDRIRPLVPDERILVITSADLAGAIRAELPELPAANVIGEPVGRNSAPAVALAACVMEATDPDAAFLVAPADHIVDGEGFRTALEEAFAFAEERAALVTFGMTPTRAETGYGYIEAGESLSGNVYRAASFHEKPDAQTAKRFVREGRFLWNSGMFVWRATTLRAELVAHAPDVAKAGEGLACNEGPLTEAALARFYEASPSISIDYALMERSSNVAVLKASFAWCDVGSWAAMGEVFGVDETGNTQHGPVLLVDAEDTIAYSDGAPIVALGIHDTIVVRVGEVTLVCARDRAGDIRDVVRRLEEDPTWRRHR